MGAAKQFLINQRDSILRDVERGVRLIDIAKRLGLKAHSSLLYHLSNDPDYQAARLVGAEARLEQREAELEQAKTNITVARSRELLSHARWRCEREFPQKWAPKQQIHAKVEMDIDAGLAGTAADLLDHIMTMPVSLCNQDETDGAVENSTLLKP